MPSPAEHYVALMRCSGSSASHLICAGRANSLQKELGDSVAKWESEKQEMQAEVDRLGQRALQADALKGEVDDLLEVKVSSISSLNPD